MSYGVCASPRVRGALPICLIQCHDGRHYVSLRSQAVWLPLLGMVFAGRVVHGVVLRGAGTVQTTT